MGDNRSQRPPEPKEKRQMNKTRRILEIQRSPNTRPQTSLVESPKLHPRPTESEQGGERWQEETHVGSMHQYQLFTTQRTKLSPG